MQTIGLSLAMVVGYGIIDRKIENYDPTYSILNSNFGPLKVIK
jgi:hypothetical protein